MNINSSKFSHIGHAIKKLTNNVSSMFKKTDPKKYSYTSDNTQPMSKSSSDNSTLKKLTKGNGHEEISEKGYSVTKKGVLVNTKMFPEFAVKANFWDKIFGVDTKIVFMKNMTRDDIEQRAELHKTQQKFYREAFINPMLPKFSEETLKKVNGHLAKGLNDLNINLAKSTLRFSPEFQNAHKNIIFGSMDRDLDEKEVERLNILLDHVDSCIKRMTSEALIKHTKENLAKNLTSSKINKQELFEQIRLLSSSPIEKERELCKQLGPDDRLKEVKKSLDGLEINDLTEEKYNALEKTLHQLQDECIQDRMDIFESLPENDNGYPIEEELSKVSDIIDFLTYAEQYLNHIRTVIADKIDENKAVNKPNQNSFTRDAEDLLRRFKSKN